MEEKKQPVYNDRDVIGNQLSISIFENARPDKTINHGVSLTNRFFNKKKNDFERQKVGTFASQLRELKRLVDGAVQWCEENKIPTTPQPRQTITITDNKNKKVKQ